MSHRHKGPSVYAPGAFIFIVVMCLVYAVGQAHRSWVRVQELELELSAKTLILEALVLPPRWLVPAGPERIVPMEITHPKPCHDPRPVPVFEPEWHYEVAP